MEAQAPYEVTLIAEAPKPSLYTLIADRLQMQRLIEEHEGEIPDELLPFFEINEQNLQVKTADLLDWREQMTAFVEMGKAKVKQAQEFIRKQEATIGRIDKSLLNAVNVYGPIKVDTRTVSSRKSEAVEIEEEGLVPVDYCTRKVTVTPDKTLIKKAIKEGHPVPGAELVTRVNLAIK